MDESGRRRAIAYGLARIEEQAGRPPLAVISSGSASLDEALGIGGFPRGRIVEIFGPESSGKTTLALRTIACAQQAGGTAAFIDAEHALDAAYARALGVNPETVLIAQPDDGEQALEITRALVASGAVDVAVVDSVAALAPRAELDGSLGGLHGGLHSRLITQALRKLAWSAARSNTCLIFINQLRRQIGLTVGDPETTSGGRALKLYASVRVEVRRAALIQVGGIIAGSRTRAKVVRNRLAAPFREAEFDVHCAVPGA